MGSLQMHFIVITAKALLRVIDEVQMLRILQVGNYVYENFASLVEAYGNLPTALAAPPPPVSQPIYNTAVSAIPAGRYAAAHTAPSVASSGR